MGATYELMASMGTQIVSGTNYRFLTVERQSERTAFLKRIIPIDIVGEW